MAQVASSNQRFSAVSSAHQNNNEFSFVSFDLPASNQKILGPPLKQGLPIPLALRQSTHNNNNNQTDVIPDLENGIQAVESLQAHDGVFTQKLAEHGALLFRGLPIHSAADFSKFSHAFGFKPHEIIGIVVDRPMLAPNVAPANEAPKEVLIYNHNESPQVPHAPEYIFFYCHSAPKEGGETPISSSLELFHRAQAEIPEFVEALTEKGILSRVTYSVERQYKGGATLKQSFGKHIHDDDDAATRRAKIEAQISRYGRGKHTTWEWSDDDKTLIVTHRLPAIRRQNQTNLPTLFTGLAALYKNAQVNKSNLRKGVTQQTFGDGTPIPEKYLKTLADITDEIRVLHKWQQGDVLVFDNVIAQHGREPWKGEQEDRVILASLWDGDSVPGAFSDQDWAQVVQALDDRVY